MAIKMHSEENRYIQRLENLLEIENKLIVELRISLNVRATFLLEKFLNEHDNNDSMMLKKISKMEGALTQFKSTTMLYNLIKVIGQSRNGRSQSFNCSRLAPTTLACLDQMANDLLDELTPVAAEFLGGAGLDAKLHSEQTIKTLIQSIPLALSYRDSRGDIPIRKLMCRINSGNASIALSILRRLREMDLIMMNDIKDLDLLYLCCNQHTSRLFEFIIDWRPKLLKEWRPPYDTNSDTHEPSTELKVPFLHEVVDYTFKLSPSPYYIELSKQIIEVAIKAGLRYHPDRLGFLNERNRDGYTVWERACEKIGMDKMWDVVERCIWKDESEGKGTFCDKNYHEFIFKSESDSFVFFSPLFLAAVESNDDSANGLNIVFHLLKKDPAKWISYACNFKALQEDRRKESNVDLYAVCQRKKTSIDQEQQ